MSITNSLPNSYATAERIWKVHKRVADDIFTHLCQLRGFNEECLLPSYTEHLHDPSLLPDIDKARSLIRQAKKEGHHVVIFGDYDADGTPACALLSIIFRTLGISHEVIIPTRESGYGLRGEEVEGISKNAKLLITVDTGITAVAEISRAKELGMKVIVIDHHLPGPSLPPADALVDPFLPASRYPFKYLCACALSYKFACSLCQDFSEINENFCKWLLDLVAISTVADMMPLVGENRALVHYGLLVMRQNRRLGLRCLLEEAKIESSELTATSLGYVIGPRLNASGRLGDNRPAFELLISDNTDQAYRLAAQVESANLERQEVVDRVMKEADELLYIQNHPHDKVFTLYQDSWPTGIVGLVAGKLANRYHRPVIVGGKQSEEIRASARSIGTYPIVDALSSQSHHLNRFGGHKQAAGLSLAETKWPEFCQGIKEHGKIKIKNEDMVSTLTADAFIDAEDISLNLARSIEGLQPFGLENPRPLLVTSPVEIEEARFLGSSHNHLKLKLRTNNGKYVDAIGFNLAQAYRKNPLTTMRLAGYVELNKWNGRESAQLQIIDFCDPSLEIVEETE